MHASTCSGELWLSEKTCGWAAASSRIGEGLLDAGQGVLAAADGRPRAHRRATAQGLSDCCLVHGCNS